MKKNKRVIIILSVLILGIGISLAYFVGKTIFSGTGATTEGRTATVNGSTLDVKGILKFYDPDIYPGHQSLSKIEVTATGDNELIAYNLTWEGNNDLNTNLKYYVYKSEKDNQEITLTCEKKKKVKNGIQYLNEECESNIEELGIPIKEGEIIKTEEGTTTKEIITDTEYITANKDGEKLYYYVIIEYPNYTEETNKEQNEDIGHNFDGKVYAEISDKSADINILGIYIKDEETGDYKEAKTMPDNNYIINSEISKCSNGATTDIDIGNAVRIINLTEKGTSCYLYYDKAMPAKSKILSDNITNEIIPDFSQTVCAPKTNQNNSNCDSSDSGLFKLVEDNKEIYYFRGTVNNNWVKFAGFFWRIIRINGDGTIRLIYSGDAIGDTVINLNKTGITTLIIVPEGAEKEYYFNYYDTDNAYVGYMYGYTNNNNYSETHLNISSSYMKNVIDSWYKSTMINAKNGSRKATDYINENAEFCNDRTSTTNSASSTTNNTGGYSKTQTYYGAYLRVKNTHQPTLKCPQNDDLFTIKNSPTGNNKLTYPVGLITADEVMYAGGVLNNNNYGFYLNVNKNYWTMTPSYYSGSANIYAVITYGYLGDVKAKSTSGMRPVLELKADTIFIKGIGTEDNPYIVQ